MTAANENDISYGLSGPTSKGEHGTLATCQRLVAALNKSGSVWTRPTSLVERQSVDCVVADQSGAELQIQVVRAMIDPALWVKLSREGIVEVSGANANAVADSMCEAIIKKKDAIPDSEVRRRIVLALNAEDFPVCASGVVVDSFRARRSDETRAAGFACIWVVGPTAQLVTQLV